MTGIIHRKIVETQVITNFHVMQNSRSIPLSEIDDIVIMNQHRESQFQGNRYHFRGSGISYGTGRSCGKSIGDLVFIYQGQPSITFRQIQDPYGVARLAKAARRNMIQQIKNLERQQVKIQKEQERETKLAEKAESLGLQIMNEVICQTCQSSNPEDPQFCKKCGSKLDVKYIDPNRRDGLSENKPSEVIDTNFEECLMPEYSIKINYPSSWTRQDDNHGVMFLSPKESPNELPLAGLMVSVDYTVGNATPETFVESVIATTRQNNSDFSLIESTPTSLSGTPAHQTIFIANQKKTLFVATKRNDVFYYLIYNLLPPSYHRFLSSAEQMISSFEFI